MMRRICLILHANSLIYPYPLSSGWLTHLPPRCVVQITLRLSMTHTKKPEDDVPNSKGKGKGKSKPTPKPKPVPKRSTMVKDNDMSVDVPERSQTSDVGDGDDD